MNFDPWTVARIGSRAGIPRRVRVGAVLAAAGLGLGVGGCAVGPQYAEPPSDAPAAWVNGRGLTGEGADLSRWWSSLGDAQLDGLVERARAGNLDLRLARARLAEARAARGVTAAELFPRVDSSGSYARSRSSALGPARGATGENDLFTIGLDASWEVDLWGRIRRGVEAADAEIDAAEESRRDVLVTLLGEVARNYVELRGFQGRLGIARENLRTQEETLELTKSRYKAGLTSELDVQRAEANAATTRSQIPLLEAGIRQASHRLSVLVGRPPGELVDELATARPIPVGPEKVPAGLPSDLLRRRPDIRRAEREIAAATARIGVATADLFPRFSLTGSFGFQSSQVGQLMDSPQRFWSFGPAVRWPVFEGGRIRSNIAVQEAKTEQALATYEKTVLASFEEVENALVSYERERERLSALEGAVRATERSVELSTSLYKAQLSDFLGVLDAQRQLFQLQDQLVQSRALVSENLIRVYKALGGGWESDEPGAAPGTAFTPPALTPAVPGGAPGAAPANTSTAG
jgi:NodT family efflux transporter outer membrane factor (OMF) lipoprotein